MCRSIKMYTQHLDKSFILLHLHKKDNSDMEIDVTQDLFQVLPVIIYRVDQNKIPHQTICNISATSGLILKILGAA